MFETAPSSLEHRASGFIRLGDAEMGVWLLTVIKFPLPSVLTYPFLLRLSTARDTDLEHHRRALACAQSKEPAERWVSALIMLVVVIEVYHASSRQNPALITYRAGGSCWRLDGVSG